jgi:hypothetical protein
MSDLGELVMGFVMYMNPAAKPISARKRACYTRALVHFSMSTTRCKCVNWVKALGDPRAIY